MNQIIASSNRIIIVDSSETWINQTLIFIMNQVIIVNPNQEYSQENSFDDQSQIYYEQFNQFLGQYDFQHVSS
jgi:hypothetical protein